MAWESAVTATGRWMKTESLMKPCRRKPWHLVVAQLPLVVDDGGGAYVFECEVTLIFKKEKSSPRATTFFPLYKSTKEKPNILRRKRGK